MNDVIECPYCGEFCDADFVDVGVGYRQCGPYHCDNCYASEIGPYDKERELSEIEKKTGWYKPHSEAGSSANVINGKIVSSEVMKATYIKEFTGNPLWNDKSYVENWYKDIRKG
jgi:hypothetical protein